VAPPAVLVEVCVESVASAVAAELGGAHRIELCSNLAVEGVTPSCELITEVRHRVSIPLHVLIRPRAGDFNYTLAEFDSMKNEIEQARKLGADGVVFGILNSANFVDVARTRELVQLARPLSVTFHRAFDAVPDQPEALQAIVRAGAERILTSGGAKSAEEGSSMLAQLVEQAAGKVAILACGSIREANVREIVRVTGVREVHTSLLVRSRVPAGDPENIQPETVVAFLRSTAEIGSVDR
jgi:copper homeostasis protein